MIDFNGLVFLFFDGGKISYIGASGSEVRNRSENIVTPKCLYQNAQFFSVLKPGNLNTP